MVKKHVAFAPGNKWGQAPFCKKEGILKQKGNNRKWGLAPFILKALLSSPPERNHARSAFLTVLSAYSLRQARESDRVGRRVCLSDASYADAEKSE